MFASLSLIHLPIVKFLYWLCEVSLKKGLVQFVSASSPLFESPHFRDLIHDSVVLVAPLLECNCIFTVVFLHFSLPISSSHIDIITGSFVPLHCALGRK